MPASSTLNPLRRKPLSLTLFVDGASRGNPGPSGVGVVVLEKKESAKPIAEIALYLGETTNNVAEYCALMVGLQEVARRGAEQVEAFTDSQLLARQVSGEYKVRDARLQWLHALVLQAAAGFSSFSIQHIPRERNKKADRLANQAVSAGVRRAGQGSATRKPDDVSGSSDQMTLF